MRNRLTVVNRSRGRYTRQEMNRPYWSLRANSLTWRRPASRRTPMTVRNRSSVAIWNSSSLG